MQLMTPLKLTGYGVSAPQAGTTPLAKLTKPLCCGTGGVHRQCDSTCLTSGTDRRGSEKREEVCESVMTEVD